MQMVTKENKQLLIKYEILRARLEIREFFLKTSVREVYENIGQVLSLVRMQLSIFDPEKLGHKTEDIVQSGDLVGQSIRDLRSMCRSFYPDVDILKNGGFIEGLESTLKILNLSDKETIKLKGTRKDIPEGLRLIAFKMMQDILIAIKKIEGKYKSMVVSYREETIDVTISYTGELIDLNRKNTINIEDVAFSLLDTAQLIEGNISTRKSKAGTISLTLQVPLKISLYE
jgi:hypothetical protein